jgi:hypothetical protein
MLEGLVGNSTAEKVLLYLVSYNEGHTSGIAQTFSLPKSQVQKQLLRLENGGIVVAQTKGSLRMFQINPRCPYKAELIALIEKVLAILPREDIEKYYRQRRRPRRTGKHL